MNALNNVSTMTKNSDTNLMSIGDAAKYLKVSIDTLRRWEKRGRLHSFRSPGNHRYFSKQELDKAFNKRYTRHTTPAPIKKPRQVSPITTSLPTKTDKKITPRRVVQELKEPVFEKPKVPKYTASKETGPSFPTYVPTKPLKDISQNTRTHHPKGISSPKKHGNGLTAGQKTALLVFFIFIIIDLILLLILFTT